MSLIGTTFAGFTVLEKINRGGMADIYLATDRDGQRFVLRLLLPEFRYSWGRIRQFNWGCKVHAQLDHPNIVKFFSEGKFSGFHYAIIEYVEGPNLKERIIRNDPLLAANQIKLLVGMASGLAHLHEHGFIHLDFKPENILVTKHYDPKLIDFDITVARPSRPKKGISASGTLAYWAPEQIARRPVDERADVFAFGVTAYEMLSGKKPVIGDTQEEILNKYIKFDEHIKPLRAHVPDIPAWLERIILKCLEMDVTRRYPSMSLVARDLQK